METPQSRLEVVVPCGIVRDGHKMAMVRFDDLQCVLGAISLLARDALIARDHISTAAANNEMAQKEIADLREQITGFRKGISVAVQTLEATACGTIEITT